MSQQSHQLSSVRQEAGRLGSYSSSLGDLTRIDFETKIERRDRRGRLHERQTVDTDTGTTGLQQRLASGQIWSVEKMVGMNPKNLYGTFCYLKSKVSPRINRGLSR